MISIFHNIIKSRFLMGIFCLIFFILSIKMNTKRCHAFAMEKASKNHFYFAPELNGQNSSNSSNPLKNRCSCPSYDKTCCKNIIASKAKDSQDYILNRDNLHQFSMVKDVKVTTFYNIPQRQKKKCSSHFNFFHQNELFLSNCSFLI